MPPGMMIKRWFAKMYGYTEAQTEETSLEALTWWPLIEEADNEAQRRRQEEENRSPRFQRRRG